MKKLTEFLAHNNLYLTFRVIETFPHFGNDEGTYSKKFELGIKSTEPYSETTIHLEQGLGFPKFVSQGDSIYLAAKSLFTNRTLKVDRMDDMCPYTVLLTEVPELTDDEYKSIEQIFLNIASDNQ